MKPYAKLYISSDVINGLFGHGKWRLLKAIELHGSLQAAAKELGRGYRKAWGDIQRAEEGFKRKLVITQRGGKQRGATELTEFGKRLLVQWEQYTLEINKVMDVAYKNILQSTIE